MSHVTRTAPVAAYARAALLSFAVAGCGATASDSLPREGVSGAVSLDGQPLEKGSIRFIPASRQEGVDGGAVIEEGKYAIERSRGLVPGDYRVVISSARSVGPANDSADGAPGAARKGAAPKDLVPSKYNVKSTLSAQVKAGAPNTFDFPMKSK